MVRHAPDRTAALGFVSRDFSTGLSAAPTVSLTVGTERADLNDRGRSIVAALFDAEPDTLARVEDLLNRRKPVEMVSPEEAAVILGVSRPTVVRWASAGELTDHPVGSHHRYPRAEVERLREARAAAAAANREAAQAARARAEEAGDLDVAPTPEELIAAGAAFRAGDKAAAEVVFARARRAEAHRSAAAAGTPAGS
ncbi:hypothetical protein GCM10023328_47690 [Modestobacter marinus]|nr:helix-turn-helix domain-containing protein [Modestobacter marinus]GGL83572.1 hypothetical protein GCM10011589_44980 [Modestobacter marinus]